MTFATVTDNRYQRQQLAALRRKAMAAPELQLSRLRGPSSSMVSEYNPNYEFGSGAPGSVQDLKEIPRENLRLVRYPLRADKNERVRQTAA
jgi:anaplastic lymphoma kinase